jgi:arsenical pump membrane protein
VHGGTLQAVTLAVAAAAFCAILVRPFGVAEAWWAVGGAALLVLAGALPPSGAWSAVLRGGDVYLFLLGMLLLAELLDTQGVFARLSSMALARAGGSQWTLFAMTFGVGALVTTFFSNDATAVVLTRAVATMIGRARLAAYPYVFACAFVANAASFVLPISNPANLVVYGGALPRLPEWLGTFLVPSMLAIALTFAALALGHRSRLARPIDATAGVADAPGAPGRGERVASLACALAALCLLVASLLGLPLGAATFAAALAAFAAVVVADQTALLPVVRGVDYGIVPLVAGLFVIVAALDRAGGLELVRTLFARVETLHGAWPALAAGAAIAATCNLINNLPVALGISAALEAHASPLIRHVSVIAVDLGPNVAISGSLATLLWMDALRRTGVEMNALRFLRSGIATALPALAAALLAAR